MSHPPAFASRLLRSSLLLIASGLGAVACTESVTGACAISTDCPGGQVCQDGGCVQLCATDLQCGSTGICEGGICAAGSRGGAPRIDQLDGDSPALCPNANDTHCLRGGIVVSGGNLRGASFFLATGNGGDTELVARVGGTDQRVELDLPDIADGSYSLVAANGVGRTEQGLTLLQGEPGQAYSPTPNELVDQLNEATNLIAHERVVDFLICDGTQSLTVGNSGFSCKTDATALSVTGTCAGVGDHGKLRQQGDRLDACTAAGWLPVRVSPNGSSAQSAAASCKTLHDDHPTLPTGTYWLSGHGAAAGFQAHCDMTTSGGGWTLALAIDDDVAYAGGAAAWHEPSATMDLVTPDTYGKSPAFHLTSGSALLFKTHDEAADHWAAFAMPTPSTVLGLVGSANLASVPDGYRAELTPIAVGDAAVACWNAPWRVTWKNYWSYDGLPDSSVFAPAGAAAGRPCGPANSYGTGVGVRTDSGNGFSDYGGSFEGYGSESAGTADVTGGSVFIYIR